MANCDVDNFQDQMKALVPRVVGYDCEFVDIPPNIIQTECPVCLQIIRKPHQVTCCGNSFCCACIELVKADKKPCPICKKKDFTDFEDKRLQRILLELKVYCSYEKSGCKWSGELRQLDNHLNTSQIPGKQLDVCQFVEVDCSQNCGKRIIRQSIETHQALYCLKRPYICEHCHKYKSTYDDVVQKHLLVCGAVSIQCPNGCGCTIQRQNKDKHLNDECSLETIRCELHYVGCTKVVPRKDMSEHLREDSVRHMSLMAISHAREIAKLQLKFDEVKERNAVLEKTLTTQIDMLQQEIKTETTRFGKELQILSKQTIVSQLILTMENFSQFKRDKQSWQSFPIYTHYHGYKMCLTVDAHGAKGKYIGVYVSLMKGEYDGFLLWPFRARITVRLLEQTNRDIDSKNFLRVHFDSSEFPDCCCRVTEGVGQAIGTDKLIAHSELESKYLKNDELRFIVSN